MEIYWYLSLAMEYQSSVEHEHGRPVEGVRDMCHVQMHQSGRTWLVVRHIYIHGSIPT